MLFRSEAIKLVCPCLRGVGVLGLCPRLKSVSLPPDLELDSFAFLSSMHHLEHLSGKLSVSDVMLLPQPHKLVTLHMDCSGPLKDLIRFQNLKYLTLFNCQAVREWDFLTRMVRLQSLFVDNVVVSPDASLLSACMQIRRLGIFYSHTDDLLTAWTKLPNLREMLLVRCSQTQDLSPLEQCPRLECFDMRFGPSRCDVAPLGRCARLKRVTFSYCQELQNLSALKACAKLWRLEVRGKSEREGVRRRRKQTCVSLRPRLDRKSVV